jgi:quinol monooxygenase YgiN
MPSLLVHHQVKNYSEWKKGFDLALPMRTKGGEISSTLYRSDSNPNDVTVISKWDSLANAHKFAQSPELKAAMEKVGVEGTPSISFLNEA